jgi:hypothetical protein
MASPYRYKSAADALEDAARMEELRDDEVSALRLEGKDAEADKLSDRWNVQIGHAQAQARELNAREAEGTAQPPPADSSTKSKRAAAGSSQGGGKRPPARGGGRGRRAESPAAPPSSSRSSRVKSSGGIGDQGVGDLAGAVYGNSGAAAAVGSWGQIGWYIIGLTLAAAVALLFLGPRGPGAFAALANGAVGALSLVLEPVDPLAPTVASSLIQSAAAGPPIPTRRAPRAVRPRRAALI